MTGRCHAPRRRFNPPQNSPELWERPAKSKKNECRLNLFVAFRHLRHRHPVSGTSETKSGTIMMTPKTDGGNGSRDEMEAALLRRIAARHRPSFEELFGAYHSRIFKFVFRLTRSYGAADELANDVLFTVWKSAGKFRGESKVSTWVFGIAYRQSLRYLRKKKPETVSLFDQDVPANDTNTDFERQNWVQQGIQELPPKQRLTVMLVYYLGLSCEETAAATDAPVSTVKTRMFHARRKMRDYLETSAEPVTMTEATENE